MQFTTVRSKEKDYDIYLKSSQKNVFPGSQPVAIQREKKWIPAIWRPNNVKLLGVRKKIMTSI